MTRDCGKLTSGVVVVNSVHEIESIGMWLVKLNELLYSCCLCQMEWKIVHFSGAGVGIKKSELIS